MPYKKIKSIKHLDKTEDCYDLQVNRVHRYYTNNILSHNSEVICAAVKAYVSLSTLILVDRIFLAQQIRDRLIKRGFSKDQVGIIYGGEKDYENKPIVVSTVQSICNFPDIYKFAEMIIIDEVKHVQSKQFQDIIKKSNAIVRVGFDATPFTEENRIIDLTIKKFVGDVIYEVTTKDLINRKILAEPKIRMIKINNDKVKDEHYQTAYSRCVTNNSIRNQIICEAVKRYEGKVLVLVSYINHGKTLNKAIDGSKFLWGEIDSQERYEEVQNFIAAEGKRVLIGSNIFSEGVDFSTGVDAIVIASADKGFRSVIQKLGRALRMNSKGYVDVWDFWDYGNKYFDERSKARFDIYQNEGHNVHIM